MGKTALIVDDSKTARVVLKRMLENHSLVVDTAESAETAIEYLKGHRPDVIFMDHLMPGMDGLEALTAIKNNPDTATIPIMMYTAQQGEVYVGQARALGAVGVLPKAVEPVEVSNVLASLRVIEANEEPGASRTAAEPGRDGGKPAGMEHLDDNIRNLVQDLFEQQRAILRRDLKEGYDSIAAKVIDEIRAPAKDGDAMPERAAPKRGPNKLRLATTMLAILVLTLGWLNWTQYQRWEAMRQQNNDLFSSLVEQQSIRSQGDIERQQRLFRSQQAAESAYDTALGALEWGINQSAHYAYGEAPLNAERLQAFEALRTELLELGFSGRVQINSHVGDFCLSNAGAAGYALAASDLAVSQCDLIGFQANAASETGQEQNVVFANFIDESQQLTAGQIRFDVILLGNSEPLVPYPPAGAEITAADWNRIALQNNRIEILLHPD